MRWQRSHQWMSVELNAIMNVSISTRLNDVTLWACNFEWTSVELRQSTGKLFPLHYLLNKYAFTIRPHTLDDFVHSMSGVLQAFRLRAKRSSKTCLNNSSHNYAILLRANGWQQNKKLNAQRTLLANYGEQLTKMPIWIMRDNSNFPSWFLSIYIQHIYFFMGCNCERETTHPVQTQYERILRWTCVCCNCMQFNLFTYQEHCEHLTEFKYFVFSFSFWLVCLAMININLNIKSFD